MNLSQEYCKKKSQWAANNNVEGRHQSWQHVFTQTTCEITSKSQKHLSNRITGVLAGKTRPDVQRQIVNENESWLSHKCYKRTVMSRGTRWSVRHLFALFMTWFNYHLNIGCREKAMVMFIQSYSVVTRAGCSFKWRHTGVWVRKSCQTLPSWWTDLPVFIWVWLDTARKRNLLIFSFQHVFQLSFYSFILLLFPSSSFYRGKPQHNHNRRWPVSGNKCHDYNAYLFGCIGRYEHAVPTTLPEL